jgi:hypothetical protein
MKTKENQLGQVSLRSIRSIAVNRGQSRSNQAFGLQPKACQLACRYGDAPDSQLEVSQTTIQGAFADTNPGYEPITSGLLVIRS